MARSVAGPPGGVSRELPHGGRGVEVHVWW